MKLNALTAISPVDGRYRNRVEELASYFSEFALIKYRLLVEAEYFTALCEIPLPQLAEVNESLFDSLREIYVNLSQEDVCEIKETEKETNHDVKAVEYFLKKRMDALGMSKFREFVHFGLTSQDVNNTAVPCLLRDAIRDVYDPWLQKLTDTLECMATGSADIPMLARTHGQPASPTRLGKEIAVFVERLKIQRAQLMRIPYCAKFGGATGNFNAHHAAYPQIDWAGFADNFVNNTLGLTRSQTTTQIEHYDNLAALFDNLKRINTILIDLARDIWTYISMEYFKQKVEAGEIGSSTMPHKINPIDFENAEGNLGLANAVFEHLSAKLPISRLQRDLTDSTVLRNTGMPLAYTVLAFKSLSKGLDKLLINTDAIRRDLDNNPAVVSEGIQTILRREGYPNPYEALKKLTGKNATVTESDLYRFIDTLNVSDAVKAELKALTPHNYTGINNQIRKI